MAPDPPVDAERYAAHLLELYPGAEAVAGAGGVTVSIEGDRGCIVILTPGAAEIRLPTVEWTLGYAGPVPSSRRWKRLALPPGTAGHRLLDRSIARAIAARRAEFLPCRFCRDQFPVEHRIDDVCHGCASKHLGIAF